MSKYKKLKDIPLFEETLNILFKHFSKSGIESNFIKPENAKSVIKNILNCGYTGYSYIEEINNFIINFKGSEDNNINFLWVIFGSGSKKPKSSILVDYEKDSGFLIFSIENNKLLPFTMYLADENSRLNIESYDYKKNKSKVKKSSFKKKDFMNCDDLRNFLKINSRIFAPITIAV